MQMIIVFDEVGRDDWGGGIANIFGVFSSVETAQKALQDFYSNQFVKHIRLTNMFTLSVRQDQNWPSSVYYYRTITLDKSLY